MTSRRPASSAEAAAARAGEASLARALVSERIQRKPAAEAAARRLLDANAPR